jgi:hypothetical protein
MLLACFTLVALGQETRGTILGRVMDSTGAVMPGVTVVVTNIGTNTALRTTTSEVGLFEVALLIQGDCEITAELPGFKKYVRRGITVSVGSRISIDIQLAVGESSESVNVIAEEPLLETTAASLGQTFDNRRIAELPVLGNNVMLLSSLAAGMQRLGGYNYLALHSNSGSSDYRTSGGVGGNEWTLDGTPNTASSRRAAYLPYTDAIEEFRVEATSFDASVGHSTGAFVIMQSKAGTNAYHGAVTENHWQQRWNATPTNDNGAYWAEIQQAEAAGDRARAAQLRSQPRQPTGRSNNYAASVGGPVILPGVYNGKNRLFFFFIFNGFKDSKTEEPNNKLFSVPTAEERRGDFSRLLRINPARYRIYDPLTTRFNTVTGLYERDPFPGNIIPPNRIANPMYRYYEKFYPLPNNPPQMDAEGRNNYFNGRIPYDWDYKAFQNRVDWVPNEKNRFFVRWSYNHFLEDRNDWTFATARFLHSNGLIRINKGGGVDYVRNFNATTVLNVAVAYNRFYDDAINQAQRQFRPSDVGLPAYMDARAGDQHSLPVVDFNAYRDVSGGFNELKPVSTAALKADLKKYRGKHSVTLGWDGRVYYRTTGSAGNASGRFEFRNSLLRQTSATTGVGELGIEWAAFMLGVPNSMSIDANDTSYITTPYQAAFIQDNYRLSNRLTLFAGLRMEYEGSIRERYDRGLRDFDFDYVPPIAAAVQAAYANDPGLAPLRQDRPASDFLIRGGANYLGLGVPRTRTNPTERVMPRLGFAYSLNSKTVVRGGYGTYYDTLNVSNTTIDLTGYSRGTSTISTADQGVNWNYGYFTNNNPPTSDPFPVREDGTRFNIPLGNALGKDTFLGRRFSFLNARYEPLKQHRWRLEIERQVGQQMLFAVAYTGAWVGNLPVNKALNPLPEKYWASGLVRRNDIAMDLNRNMPNPFYIGNLSFLQSSQPLLYQQLSTLTFFNSRTISKAQLLRPFPHMTGNETGLQIEQAPIGKNVYNAMQLRFDKRFARGFTFNTHYEWSHTRSKDWFPDEFDPEPDWRESDNSRPHRWVATGIYELPLGRQKRFLNNAGLLTGILGGLQIGAIWQMQSGEAIDFNNVFYYGNNLRDIVLPAKQRSRVRWFNTDNFETNSTRTPTSYHRRVFPNRMNWLRTDRIEQLDVNVQKTIRINEGVKALFRVDLLNAPNHQVLSGPNADPTNASFGRVNGTVNTPRYVQLQLRVTY